MDRPPDDLDASRAAVAAKGLVATVAGYLTEEVVVRLPFEALASYKDALKRFLSGGPWTDADAEALADLVAPHLVDGWWEHDLGGGLRLGHGIRAGRYRLWVTGAAATAPSIFDRAFTGPVVPEPTPHPRKVKLTLGGEPAPGRWYRRGDPVDDDRVRRLFAEPDVTDVMVAGDFVTVGITGSWEERLEPILALVTELYGGAANAPRPPGRTRDELVTEGGKLARRDDDELHLLDPDDPEHRHRLLRALEEGTARDRRVAVVVLAGASEPAARARAVLRAWRDRSLQVRRTALDAAADTGDEGFRALFEEALADADPWVRWRAVRALGDLGLGTSEARVASLRDDPEFRVRFEAERVLRRPWDPRAPGEPHRGR